MSFESIRIGASGLAAAQRGSDIASHNTANAGTVGYTRQRLTLAAAPAGFGQGGQIGTGVEIGDLQRMRSTYADSAFRQATGTSGAASAMTMGLTRVQDLLGGIDGGLPAALNAFYDAANTLSLQPADSAARQQFLSASTTLATQFATMAQGIDAVVPDLNAKAADIAHEVNTLADHVASLNLEIADATVRGQVPADLMDARDTAVDRLAELTGARSGLPDARGVVTVYVGSQPLVSEAVATHLRVTPTATGPAYDFADGSPVQISAGQLGGLAAAGAKTLDLRTHLDTVAAGIISQVNAVQTAGYDLTGAPGGPLFVGTTAATMHVAAGMTPGGIAAGSTPSVNDGNNALALASLRDAKHADGMTDAMRLGGWVSTVGLTVAEAQLRRDTTLTVATGLNSERTAQHAVNIDEEMVDMIRYQRAYQASAKAVSVADSMLDTLINRII